VATPTAHSQLGAAGGVTVAFGKVRGRRQNAAWQYASPGSPPMRSMPLLPLLTLCMTLALRPVSVAAGGTARGALPAGSPQPVAWGEAGPADWHFSSFLDVGHALNFNYPANRLWRNRGTTPRVNETQINMAGLMVAKEATAGSPWGMELLAQAGRDALAFGFHTNQPRLDSADVLRHLGRANVSFLAPAAAGLKVQAGLFGSLIGHESLYARDNAHQTRSWIADYSPYLMFGVNASLPLGQRLTATAYVVNGYFHLSQANAQPGYGAQLAYRPSSRWTLRETVYWGPEQADTGLGHWRFFLDTMAEWRGDGVSVAFGHQAGTERLALPGNPRAFWTGAMLSGRVNIGGPWSVALRPEVFWDPDGLLTGARQLVRAVTTTLEYRLPWQGAGALLRLEHRYDESTGPQGGFFGRRDAGTGAIGLTPAQHQAIASMVFTFDAP